LEQERFTGCMTYVRTMEMGCRMKNTIKAALVALMIIGLIAVIMPAIASMPTWNGGHSSGAIDENQTSTGPARIELRAEISHLMADGYENIELTTYVYDAQDNPVADYNQVNFTIGNAESNAYTGGFAWSINNGSFSAPQGSGTFTNVTMGGTGSTTARFGWVPEGFGGENSTIWAYVNGTDIHATVKIYFANSSFAWTGRVVDSSGIGYGSIPVTLHVMGVNQNDTLYEIYNMTRTTSNSQPFVGRFTFGNIVMDNMVWGYVDASYQLTDSLTIYGKSDNFSMNGSTMPIGDIVLKALPPDAIMASPSATAKPTPGFEALFALAGLLGVAYLITRKEDLILLPTPMVCRVATI